MESCWLPEIIVCPDLSDWASYEDNIYHKFRHAFISNTPIFKGKPVKIRWPNLFEEGKEKEFWHMVTRDYDNTQNRSPDLRRCERILWARALIENWESCISKKYSDCRQCNGLKMWEEKNRVKMLLEDERYILVLEERKNCWLFITAFCLEETYMRKLLRKLGNDIDSIYAKQQDTPL